MNAPRLLHAASFAKIVTRTITTSPRVQLKEILTANEGNNVVISARNVPSEREPYAIKSQHTDTCTLCSLGLDVKHTDVLILSQYVRWDGCMLPRRVTGLCTMQQKRVSTLVTMAQKAGLMSNLNPANSKKDPRKRYQWKAHNKYFDESTIKV